jgi:hypothetical protein
MFGHGNFQALFALPAAPSCRNNLFLSFGRNLPIVALFVFIFVVVVVVTGFVVVVALFVFIFVVVVALFVCIVLLLFFFVFVVALFVLIFVVLVALFVCIVLLLFFFVFVYLNGFLALVFQCRYAWPRIQTLTAGEFSLHRSLSYQTTEKTDFFLTTIPIPTNPGNY